MFFRKKDCERCDALRDETEQLRKQLLEAHARIDDLEAELKNSLKQNISHDSSIDGGSVSSVASSEAVNVEHPRDEGPPKTATAFEPQNDEKNHHRRLSDEDRARLQEKRDALKSRTATDSVINSKPKVQMSDADRRKLSEKRAALKAKLGLNPETREDRLKRMYDEQAQMITAACEQHLPTLARNFRRSQAYNDYGVLVSDRRAFEAAEFLRGVEYNKNYMNQFAAIQLVMSTVEKLQEELKNEHEARGFSATSFPEDGLDFEHWVSDALQGFGWQARATKGSGDQGIDVIATQDGLSLGIQCKRYSGSVGNKSVQEAFSGAKFMGLDRAAVLTNAEFTRSAKELAASTGVLLLSPDDIPTLLDKLRN